MKNKLYLIPIAVLLSFILASCESATNAVVNPITVVPSNRTLFVVNEGVFTDKNSTLDAILFHHDSTKTDTIMNPGVLTGMGEGNDILITGNHVLVLDNGTNTIFILDADSLGLRGTIQFGLDGPNKMALIDTNRLLVTRRNTLSAAIVDLTKNAIVDSIPIGEPSVAVAVLNNKAFITSGYYAPDGHLNVYDLSANKIIQRSLLPYTPEQAVVDSVNNQILIGTDGNFDTINPIIPKIFFVNAANNTFSDSLVVGNSLADGEITTGQKHFLIINGGVYPVSTPTHTLPTPLINSSALFYKGYYDATANELYLGEYNFGAANGKVDVFNGNTGAAKWSFTTGIAPAHFAFYH